MIDIISLEKVLIDFIIILNDQQLKNFTNKILEILNLKNTLKINYENNHINSNKNTTNICNYPRTKNRGLCRRKCINSVHCVYHTKDKIPNNVHINPHIPCNISNKNTPKNKSNACPLELNIIEYKEIDDLNQYKKLKIDKNIKVKYKNCIFIEDVPNQINASDNFQVIPNDPDENNLLVQSENIPKKKKKTKKRYIKEYKILCDFYEENFKNKLNNIHISQKGKDLINKNLDYDKNKTNTKDLLENMLYTTSHVIIQNEQIDEHHSITLIITYMYTLANTIKNNNYENSDFLNIKELIKEY